jgi:hypothetical protein
MYGEDADLSLRLRKNKMTVYFVPDSIIYHKVSASIGGAFSLTKIKRKFRSNLKLMIRHAKPYQWVSQAVSMPFLLLFGLLKYIRLTWIYHSSSL